MNPKFNIRKNKNINYKFFFSFLLINIFSPKFEIKGHVFVLMKTLGHLYQIKLNLRPPM